MKSSREHAPTGSRGSLLCHVVCCSPIIFSGCSEQGVKAVTASQAPAHVRVSNQGAGEAELEVLGDDSADLGTVIANNGTIRHQFKIRNRGRKQIRLLNATALMPCCSAIGRVSESIAPGESGSVEILVRTGSRSGHKRLGFSVRTDSAGQPEVKLSVAVHLAAEHEVDFARGLSTTVPAGKPSTLVYRVISRAQPTQLILEPPRIRVADPLKIEGISPNTTRILSDRVTETSFDVKLTVPPDPSSGPRRSELALDWADGTGFVQIVSWEVSPRITATPSALIIRETRGPSDCPVILQSDVGGFRILKVAGAGFPGEETAGTSRRMRHSLVLKIDGSTPGVDGREAVVITTDHPEQQIVRLGVLRVPANPGELK